MCPLDNIFKTGQAKITEHSPLPNEPAFKGFAVDIVDSLIAIGSTTNRMKETFKKKNLHLFQTRTGL